MVGPSLSRKNGGLYNTYHELLSEKWIVKKSRNFTRHKLHQSPQAVPISVTPHLVGCIEYYYNSFGDKVDKRAVPTSYQLGWIDYTLKDIFDQNEINRPVTDSEVH